MRNRLWSILSFGLTLAVFAPHLSAQGFPFSIRVQQPDFIATVGNGATIAVNTQPGASDLLQVNLVYLGSGNATINVAPTLEGSTAFSLENAGATPATLLNGQAYAFQVRFTPNRPESVTALLSLGYDETITTATGSATAQGNVSLGFSGTTPNFVVSYIPPDTQSVVPVNAGDVIPFSPAAVNAVESIVLSIANRGSGAGTVRSLRTDSVEFSIAGLPLLPLSLAPGNELRVVLRFQPRTAGEKTAILSFDGAGGPRSFTLAATSFRLQFGYEVLSAEGALDVLPGATINLGEALPGETVSAQLLVTNINPVPISLPPVAIFGAGFGLTEVPVNRTLQPGETVGFFIQALLNQVGALRARLRVGDDAFDVVAIGSGAQLRYSFTSNGSGSVALQPGGAIFFPPTTIATTSSAIVTVRNSGISEANVINIATADTSGIFTLQDLPALPIRLEPGQELQFQVIFRPNAAGALNSVLRIDSATFNLSGTASALPPLPNYRFTLPSGNIGPLDQPAVGLELTEAYPLPLNGVLDISQEAVGFANDPSVRFSNGAQSIPFTIPANTTRAIFPNGNNTIRFQTGSVAGSLFLEAVFGVATTQLEDPHRNRLVLNIPNAPPRILSGAISPGGNSLTVAITGLTVNRSLTRMNLVLNPVAGFNLQNAEFSINLEGESLAWFRSEGSRASGGIFFLQLPLIFSISGNTLPPPVSNLIESIVSIDVTLTNETGSSNQFTISLR